MKAQEKLKARELREQGWSINQISKELSVGKGSVSIWVRDIELTNEQLKWLSRKGHTLEVVEKRRKSRLEREEARRQVIIDRAEQEFLSHKKNELFIAAIALYWGEGGKTKRGLVRVSNGDPVLIQVFMKFLREFCKVPEDKLRGYIQLHPHLDEGKALRYWSSVSKIPPEQFFNTHRKVSKASQGKKDSLPYGTFSVYVCSTELFLKIKGWTSGLIKHLNL